MVDLKNWAVGHSLPQLIEKTKSMIVEELIPASMTERAAPVLILMQDGGALGVPIISETGDYTDLFTIARKCVQEEGSKNVMLVAPSASLTLTPLGQKDGKELKTVLASRSIHQIEKYVQIQRGWMVVIDTPEGRVVISQAFTIMPAGIYPGKPVVRTEDQMLEGDLHLV